MLNKATMTHTLVRATALLLVVFSFAISCKDDEPAPVATITGFNPASGFTGSKVVISGQHFSEDLAANIVKFNGTAADITAATRTELTVMVPENATTGTISVTVDGHTATSEGDFTVLKTSVGEFSPASGVVGTTVVISGENFDPAAANNVVKFNGVAASVLTASATKLTAAVPADATTGKITVISGNRTVTSTADFTVLKTTIDGFSPASGVVGTDVIITGTNFLPGVDDNIVTIGGATATVSAASATQLTATVPQQAVTGKVTVTIYGVTTTSAGDFTVLVPVITDIDPATAPVGAEIAIHGEHFSAVKEDNDVRFVDNLRATVVSATETELVVVVPFETYSGAVSVTVHGKTGTSANTFQLTSPSYSEMTPDVGAYGTEVVISGTGFSPVKEFNIITFDGIAAEVTSVTHDAIHVIVPDGVTTGELRISAGPNGPIFVVSEKFQVCNDHPELILSNADIIDVGDDGKSFTLMLTIGNVGGAAASFADVKATFILSQDGAYDPGDIKLEDGMSLAAVGTLQPGQSYTDNFIFVPAVTVADYPHLIFYVYTASNSLGECDIGNNVDMRVFQ
jgi:hypothetical protein